MAKSDLRIDILGTVITISADEKPEYLKKLLDKYRQTIENVQRISGLRDPLKAAVLTGFLLCDDLEKAAGSGMKNGADSGDSGEAEKLTLGMISLLDEALKVTSGAETPQPVVGAANGAVGDSIFKLQNTVKNYEWGSSEWLPDFLGEKNRSRIPWAELWMGVNPAGPSRVAGAEGLLLSELIGRNPQALLGRETAETYGKLPFLFKVEAAEKPLSIQTHPSREQAREGFERENREGILLDAPNRNYRDANHKPEIFCALNPFAALCGFRKPLEIKTLIDILSRGYTQGGEGALKNGLESLVSALENENPLKAFLAALFSLGREAREALGFFIKARRSLLERDFPEYRDEWELCAYLANLYPGDPGIIAPLYLNIIELAPGQAMYLPAGVFHAYIHGMGVELMADSDNVLRGGLTSKHVDADELFKILSFSEYKPEILKVPDPVPPMYTYPAPSREFALSVLHGSGGVIPYTETGPSIVLVTGGSAAVNVPGGGGETILARGESAFIPAGVKAGLEFSGTFTAYVAACRSS